MTDADLPLLMSAIDENLNPRYAALMQTARTILVLHDEGLLTERFTDDKEALGFYLAKMGIAAHAVAFIVNNLQLVHYQGLLN